MNPSTRSCAARKKCAAAYKEVSGAERPAHWLPFQTICEKCGCIGTTEVSDYDGREVSYMCRVDKVVNTKLNLGRGCGYEGRCRLSTDAGSCRGSSNGSQSG